MNEELVQQELIWQHQKEHETRMDLLGFRYRLELIGLLKPKFGVDGNSFFFLYGEDLQNGIAGFGKTPNDASVNFYDNWMKFQIKGAA